MESQPRACEPAKLLSEKQIQKIWRNLLQKDGRAHDKLVYEGFAVFMSSFVDSEGYILSCSKRVGMSRRFVFKWIGRDLVLEFEMNNLVSVNDPTGKKLQQIPMRAVAVMDRKPGLRKKLIDLARYRQTAILYCGEWGERIPIPSMGPWILPDGRIVTNHGMRAQTMVNYFNDPVGAEKQLKECLQEASRVDRQHLEENVFPMIDKSDFTHEAALELKRRIGVSLHRRPSGIGVNTSKETRNLLQSYGMDTFCGILDEEVDQILALMLREVSVTVQAQKWATNNLILPYPLHKLIPEEEIGASSNFDDWHIPAANGIWTVSKENAEEYKRRIFARIHEGLKKPSIERQQQLERAAQRELEESLCRKKAEDERRRLIQEERKRAETKAPRYPPQSATPTVSSRRNKVRARQEATAARLLSNNSLFKAAHVADKSAAYKEGVQRDSKLRAQAAELEHEKKIEKARRESAAARSAAIEAFHHVVPQPPTLADFLPAWNESQQD